MKKTSWIFKKYVRELASLLKLSEDGVMIVGISKDSDVSHLGAKIMTETLLSLNTELAGGEKRGRSLVRALRDLIKKEGCERIEKTVPSSFLGEVEQDFSDEAVYSELAR